MQLLQDPYHNSPAASTWKELLVLAENCFNRLRELAEAQLKKMDEKLMAVPTTYTTSASASVSENESDYLQFASEPSSRRESKAHQPSGHVRTSSAASESSSYSYRGGKPTSPIMPLKVPQLSRPIQATAENVNVNLSALRREHETALVAQQKEKAQRILRARAGGLEKNEAYVSDLLKRRQNLLASVNDKLAEVYSSISAKALVIKNSIETELRRKSIKNAVTEALQRGQDVTVIPPIVDMLRSQSDPIALLVRDFLDRCRQQLLTAERQSDPSAIVDRVFDEIAVVEYHLVELISQNFEDLQDTAMRASIRISIQSYFFSTTLSPSLQYHLRRSAGAHADEYEQQFHASSWQGLFERLKVRTKLQLPRDRSLDTFPISDPGIYARAIEDLREVSLQMTPYDKLLCLVRCCNSICQAVDDFKRESTFSQEGNRFPGEESSVGSEDLLLLSAYVIVRGHVPDLASQLTFISKLVPEELIRGEAGYVLATIQTSLDYAVSQLSNSGRE